MVGSLSWTSSTNLLNRNWEPTKGCQKQAGYHYGASAGCSGRNRSTSRSTASHSQHSNRAGSTGRSMRWQPGHSPQSPPQKLLPASPRQPARADGKHDQTTQMQDAPKLLPLSDSRGSLLAAALPRLLSPPRKLTRDRAWSSQRRQVMLPPSMSGDRDAPCRRHEGQYTRGLALE